MSSDGVDNELAADPCRYSLWCANPCRQLPQTAGEAGGVGEKSFDAAACMQQAFSELALDQLQSMQPIGALAIVTHALGCLAWRGHVLQACLLEAVIQGVGADTTDSQGFGIDPIAESLPDSAADRVLARVGVPSLSPW